MNIVSLLETLVNSLIEAEDEFFKNPKDFHALEKATKASTETFSAGFLGEVLTSVNKQICECPWRNEHYSIQRNDRRTVISSVGDVSFDCTYFKKKADGSYSYLLEALTGLTRNERFTEEAEVLLLTEALKTSYREATRVLPSKQEITKTKERFIAYTNEMLRSARNTDSIEKLQTYVIQNWSAIRRTMRNSMLNGCSAESHESHVLSDRLSSRPMGWSQVGADRMSKLRCYERNHGRGKLIDLVRYSRKQRIIKAIGTDCVPVREVALREIRKEHYNKAKSYIELIQASIPGTSARKAASIRGHLRLI